MKFYGQFDPPVDQFIYERYFKMHKNSVGGGIFIECGAFDGVTECSCKFFEEELGWKGINVEPSPPIYEQLVLNRPNSINVNAALSNKNGSGTFFSVIHPTYGELCTNGSLNHSEHHKMVLNEMGCSYKEYEVPIITYSELVTRYKIRKCDLFVLDVEGNELKVIESMHKCKYKKLPRIFVVEHGNLKQEQVIEEVEKLGYLYDTSSYVNSYFIKNTNWNRFCNWIKEKFNFQRKESEFFIIAKEKEYYKEGKKLDYDVSKAIVNENAFSFVSAVKSDGYIILFSVSGIEGMPCDKQEIYYRLTDSNKNEYIFRACQQERKDYAEARHSNLYLKSGGRIIIKDVILPVGSYGLQIYIKQEELFAVPIKWTIHIAENSAEVE